MQTTSVPELDSEPKIELTPADVVDPVVEAYKKGVDVTLLRENLKRSVEERINRMQDAINCIEEIRRSRPGQHERRQLTDYF